MKLALGRLGSAGTRTLIQRAITSLRARGSDAHLWLPGVGTLNGLTTGNYLESTGNTLATVDNPTGLVLDALGTVGVELAPPMVVGGSWVEADGASTFVTVNDGSISIVTDGLSAGGANFLGGIALPGKTFRIVVTTTGTGQLKAVYGGGETVFTDSLNVTVIYGASGTSFSFYRVANQAANRVITSVSVREVSGIHLTQTTTASKPVLRRGLTNLLTYSSDFSNAAWTKTSVTVAGTNIVEDSTTSTHIVRRDYAFSAGSHTIAIEAKTGTGTRNIGLVFSTSGVGALFNPSTGAVVAIVGTPTTSAVLQSNGYWLFTVTATIASITDNCRVYLGNGSTWLSTYAGDGASSVDVRTAALFQGTLTAAQILAAGGIPVTTTAAASNPDSGRYAWRFDGSNDKLDMGSLPFGLADDHAFIVGAQSGQVGTSIALCGLYSSVANNPRLQMYIGSANNLSMQYRSDGGTSVAPALSPALANFTPFVGSMRKTGTSATLRQNGSLSTTVSVATVDVVTADRAVVGETKGSYMNGPIGPVLAIKGTVTDAELLMYERLIAALTPGAPTF